MIEPGLKNKVVLVTGGNNPYGIGAVNAVIRDPKPDKPELKIED